VSRKPPIVVSNLDGTDPLLVSRATRRAQTLKRGGVDWRAPHISALIFEAQVSWSLHTRIQKRLGVESRAAMEIFNALPEEERSAKLEAAWPSKEEQAAMREQIGKGTYRFGPNDFITEKAMATLEEATVELYLAKAWEKYDEESRDKIGAELLEVFRRAMAGPLQGRVREVLMTKVEGVVEAMWAEREAQMRSRITEEVNARWEKAVDDVVAARLAEAREKIIKEFAGR
jgi:hypothetical protein